MTAGGQTALHLACQSHNKETLELLLTHPDIDPSIVNSQVSLNTMISVGTNICKLSLMYNTSKSTQKFVPTLYMLASPKQ